MYKVNSFKIDRKKSAILILTVLTIFRIVIAMKIPLFAQGNAADDDYLYIRYTKNLLLGKWLGNFNEVTLAKSISYCWFLIINNWSGFPYQLLLIMFYIFSLLVLVYAINGLIKSRYFSAFLYLFLLYSPIMLHQENVQKIYRGGVQISSSILVLGSFIGLYAFISSKKQWLWVILASISLPFFYFVKEDSIWIMPFVITLILMTAVKSVLSNENIITKIITIIFSCMPIFSLFAVSDVYKSINYKYYGVSAITDRGGTYFKNFLHDLLVISEENNDNPKIWITSQALKKAEKYSSTLRPYSKRINTTFDGNKIEGDLAFWNLRDALANIYTKNGYYVNNFYRKVDLELKQAFKSGKLKKSNRIYISTVAQGLSKNDILWIGKTLPQHLNTMYTYKYNELSVNQATGNNSQILAMSQMTNSNVIWPGTMNTYKVREEKKFLAKVQFRLVNNYKKLGAPFFIIGLIGLLILSFKAVYKLVSNDFSCLSLWLVCFGMFLSGGALFVGVQWFTRFLTEKKFYDYICCAIVIMQILESVGIYTIFKIIKKLLINFFIERSHVLQK